MNYNEELSAKLMAEEMMETPKEVTDQAAKSLFQAYQSYIEAGFTETQAMELAKYLMYLACLKRDQN